MSLGNFMGNILLSKMLMVNGVIRYTCHMLSVVTVKNDKKKKGLYYVIN